MIRERAVDTSRFYRVVIGPNAGACGCPGVTIQGCNENSQEYGKRVINKDYFRARCKKRSSEKGGCPLCTANIEYPSEIVKFCPFSDEGTLEK